MKVTVAICTWNRAALLDQTLEGMKCLQIPEDVTWELLVVNNNCTDNTDEVIKKHAQILPLKRLFEPKQGHSNARNCAVEHTTGELLLWTDDDVRVDTKWLAAYVDAANRYADAVYFGGLITPWYEINPPPWVIDNLHLLQGYLVIRDLGNVERPFVKGELPYGANMAFRTEIQRQFIYDKRLGNVKKRNLAGEEADVLLRMRAAGFSGIWLPNSKVEHFVSRQRLEIDFFQSFCKDRGAGSVHFDRKSIGPRLFGAPRWLWRALLISWMKYQGARLTSRTSWVEPLIEHMTIRGMIAEHRVLQTAAMST